MSRLEKKCLLASAGTHGFLLLLLLFGSAFFVAKEKSLNLPRINIIPGKLVEDTLSGGGGNPNLPRSDEQIKGETLKPQPPAPAPQIQPKPPQAQVQPPTPKPEPKKPEPPKPNVSAQTKKPAEPVKPTIDLKDLKPIVRGETEKQKAAREAAAKEAARQESAFRQKMANKISQTREGLKSGFSQGTKVDIGGPGGVAYANYAQFVQAAYDDAWVVLPDLANDDSVALVKVTIARDGRVVNARFIDRSGNSAMDRSVQRALDKVKDIGQPFPAGSTDAERTFTIEFNLKAKRLTG